MRRRPCRRTTSSESMASNIAMEASSRTTFVSSFSPSHVQLTRKPTFTSPPHRPQPSCRQTTALMRSWRAVMTPETKERTKTPEDIGNPIPLPEEQQSTRMFSNIEPGKDGSFLRVPPSELGCAALIAGTMVGAGVLALPAVAAPAGYVPSSFALVGVWAYMSTTGLLISELSINVACSIGRPSGVSLLSLGELTLGKAGSVVAALSYTLLHYAILTAYTSQGGAMLIELLRWAESALHTSNVLPPQALMGTLFAVAIGGGMYALSKGTVERINNAMVAAVIASFGLVVAGAGGHVDASRLLSDMHWGSLVHGSILPVLFVSCVYHNVVSTVTMRLEGDRKKIRRVILGGSALPLAMFLIYNGAILGSGGLAAQDGLAVACFSLLAVATSFVGFVEGLTELWTDVRITALGQSQAHVAKTKYQSFIATLVPPVAFTALSPDIFLPALDAAGTYGIAVLFGGLPAAMAWRNRQKEGKKGFKPFLGGGNGVLALVALIPALLIGNRILEGVHNVLDMQ